MREVDQGYLAQCPAHDDRHASLTIRQGEKGLMFKCHTGCTIGEIRDQLGLVWSDLLSKEGGEV